LLIETDDLLVKGAENQAGYDTALAEPLIHF
jgi:hypothetical protein